MKYIITFELTTFAARNASSVSSKPARLRPTGRSCTAAGSRSGHDKGFMLAEAAEPAPIYRWVSQWADLFNFEVHPVLEDAEIAKVLKTLN